MMNNREPLDEFLSQFSWKQRWAQAFTFVMSALGLVVVIGLVGMTVWGFASYESARRTLSDTTQRLDESQRKIGELESRLGSNNPDPQIVQLQEKLSASEKLVAEKEAKIAALETQPQTNAAVTPSNPQPAPPDCAQCQTTVDQKQANEISRLTEVNRNLQNQLEICKRGRGKAGTPTVDKRTDILH